MIITILLGKRIRVTPLDLVKKQEGKIIMPVVGEYITSNVFYTARVEQIGESMKDVKHHFAVGEYVLCVKGGALDLPDGTRVVSVEDVMGHIDTPVILKAEPAK